ncbi:hypothetical protein [Paractinoplanes maris]|uniref:hypothetical protein n=1 Tax=Paractinoplanes maris TaxID=1734446 RepID=UPI002021791B|nr:hypothetical protein [Actinoplanes maris]
MTRYVSEWTTPNNLHVGDRAINPQGIVREWDGHQGLDVCLPCDKAMTEYTASGERCCPTCGAVAGREQLPACMSDSAVTS